MADLSAEGARQFLEDLFLIEVLLSLPPGFVGIPNTLPQVLQDTLMI